jgi:hypothetical protein
MTTSNSASTVRLNRVKLLLVALVFLAPFVAALIAVGVGWQPGTHSHGKPILPQRSFRDIRIAMDSGSKWAWRNPKQPQMTLVALSSGRCGRACVKNLILLRNARITLNKYQERVRLLYLGQPPAGEAGKVLMQSWHHGRDVNDALAAFRPQQSGAVSALLVESNGTALVQYPAGFSADGIKDDLHKVLH